MGCINVIILWLAGYAEPMQIMNDVLAQLDVMVSLAHVSTNAPVAYVRPKLHVKGTASVYVHADMHQIIGRGCYSSTLRT